MQPQKTGSVPSDKSLGGAEKSIPDALKGSNMPYYACSAVTCGAVSCEGTPQPDLSNPERQGNVRPALRLSTAGPVGSLKDPRWTHHRAPQQHTARVGRFQHAPHAIGRTLRFPGGGMQGKGDAV